MNPLRFISFTLLPLFLFIVLLPKAGLRAQATDITTPIEIPLFAQLLDAHNADLGGFPHYKYGIYVSLAGSTTPQLYEFDTGGPGFYAVYADPNGRFGTYTPAWGTNYSLINPTNGSSKYTSGNSYTGGTVSTSFILYGTNSQGALTPSVTSNTNLIVGQTTNIVNDGTTLWPSRYAPIPNNFYGDFGMDLEWKTNGAVNPIAQLDYSSGMIPGYIIHLGTQPTSDRTDPTGSYVQVGITAAQLADFPLQLNLLKDQKSNLGNFANSGVSSYDEPSFIASMTLSNPKIGVTNVSLPIVLDSGATPTYHYAKDTPGESLLKFFDSNSVLSLNVTNTSGVTVTLYSTLIAKDLSNAIWVDHTEKGLIKGWNDDLNIGEQLFYQYDVAFDLADGIIAFNPLAGGTTPTNNGTVSYQSNTVLTSLTIAGGLTAVGAGITLNPINKTTVDSGELLVNGMLITPLVNIDTSASIAGSGVIIGNVSNSGTLNLSGLTINGVIYNFGLLSGNGTLNGNLSSSGTIVPGSTSNLGTLTINGNIVLNPSGSLVIPANGSTNSMLMVSGSATLGGTLAIIPMSGASLSYGQHLPFLSADSINGSFNSIDAPSGFRGRLEIIGDPTAVIVLAPSSYTQLALTQNQTNVAKALDSFISATNGDKLTVSTTLDNLTASQYQTAFNAIMPTIYQSESTTAFNLANAQNQELLQRLWGVRLAGTGFSMSGFADNTPVIEGQGDKGVLDSKKDILRPGADNHWGMFVDGNGIFAKATSGNMLPTYNSQSGGITTGLTYKWNEKFGTGIYAGYEGSYNKYSANSGYGNGSTIIDNSVRFGVFGTYGNPDGKGFHADGLVGGGYNNYNVSRAIAFSGLSRTATSSPGAGELDSLLAGGYDFKRGNWTYGPTTSLQYTYFGAQAVNEQGAQSLDFNSGGWQTSSLLYSLGGHAAYTWQANRDLVVVPQINLSWQHEFLQNPYNINGSLGGSPSFNNTSSAPLRDTLYTGVGVTLEYKNKWNTSFFYNASAGNSDLVSQNVFWSLGCKF